MKLSLAQFSSTQLNKPNFVHWAMILCFQFTYTCIVIQQSGTVNVICLVPVTSLCKTSLMLLYFIYFMFMSKTHVDFDVFRSFGLSEAMKLWTYQSIWRRQKLVKKKLNFLSHLFIRYLIMYKYLVNLPVRWLI